MEDTAAPVPGLLRIVGKVIDLVLWMKPARSSSEDFARCADLSALDGGAAAAAAAASASSDAGSDDGGGRTPQSPWGWFHTDVTPESRFYPSTRTAALASAHRRGGPGVDDGAAASAAPASLQGARGVTLQGMFRAESSSAGGGLTGGRIREVSAPGEPVLMRRRSMPLQSSSSSSGSGGALVDDVVVEALATDLAVTL